MSYIRPRGFGDAASDVGVGFQVATPVVTGALTASAASTIAAGGTPLILGLAPALAIPIVGAVLAGVAIGIELLLHSGCGQTCVVTSQWANQASSQLDKMMAAYFGTAAPRPQSLQTACLQIFNAVWNQLVQNCSQPNLGTAGQNCISDRQDGACKWKAKPPAYPGEPATGDCWNWWNAYYYPIANDTNVVPDSQLSSTSSDSGASSLLSTSADGSVSSSNWLLLAVAVGVGIWALS